MLKQLSSWFAQRTEQEKIESTGRQERTWKAWSNPIIPTVRVSNVHRITQPMISDLFSTDMNEIVCFVMLNRKSGISSIFNTIRYHNGEHKLVTFEIGYDYDVEPEDEFNYIFNLTRAHYQSQVTKH